MIQNKLAELIGQIEAVSAWIDQVTHRLNTGESYDRYVSILSWKLVALNARILKLQDHVGFIL